MYVKIINGSIVDATKNIKDGYYKVNYSYDLFMELKNKGAYLSDSFGIKCNRGIPVIKNKIETNDKTEANDKTENNIEYLDKAFQEIDRKFKEQISTPVLYKNGYTYKPSYAADYYEPLISAEIILQQTTQGKETKFPLTIWDATDTYSQQMSVLELKDLAVFLANIYEKLFQAKKQAQLSILKQKERIQNANNR